MRQYFLLTFITIVFIFKGWSQNGRFMPGIDFIGYESNILVEKDKLYKPSAIENKVDFTPIVSESNSSSERGLNCLSFVGGPYFDLETPPCENSCGTPATAGFQVWGNEAYVIEATSGSQYTFEFCSGYSAATWPAIITVAEFNGFNGAVSGTILESVSGCNITFTTPLDKKYIIVISEETNCGGPYIQINNGFVTLDCGPNGANCYACTAGTLANTGYEEICPGDSIEVSTNNDQLIPTTGGYGWNFVPGPNGTGGPFGGSSFSFNEANPIGNFWGNSLGGSLGNSVLQGTWNINGFTYEDANNPLNSVCESTPNSLTVNFLNATATACLPPDSTGNLDTTGAFGVCTPPYNLSIDTRYPDTAIIYWDGVADVYDIVIVNLSNGEVFEGTPTNTNVTSPDTIVGLIPETYYSVYVRGRCFGNGLVLTGVIDATLPPDGLPKAIELYAYRDIDDLSRYSVGSANNGEGSDGEEFSLSGNATKGDFIYVSSSQDEFESWFGFEPNFVNSVAEINGDDAIELFHKSEVVDVFGEIDVDGTGEPWEYRDGWGYRIDSTGPDGSIFRLENWFFSGPGGILLTDTSNATCNSPAPFGTYVPGGGTGTGGTGGSSGGGNSPWNYDEFTTFFIDGPPCLVSRAIDCTTNMNVNLATATVDLAPSGCNPLSAYFWYRLEGDGLRWDIITTSPSSQIVIQVHQGDCDSLFCIEEANNSISFLTTAGQEYLIRIGSNTSIDEFNLNVVCQPPANNLCAGAPIIRVGNEGTCNGGVGLVSGLTIDASDTETITCDADEKYDLFYKFTANSEAIKFNSLNGDPGIEIFDGTCDSLGSSLGCINNESGIINGLTVGNDYFAVVWTNNQESSVAFCLEKFIPVTLVANDTCEGAIAVNCNTDIEVDGTKATINGSPARACSGSGAGLWYTFVGDGQIWTITATPQTSDIEIHLYTGGCDNLICEGEVNNAALAETLEVVTVSGTTYLLYIAGANESRPEIDNFNLSISCAPQVCETPTDIVVDSVTSTTANLSWTPGDEETSWNLEIVDITNGGSFTGTPTFSGITDTFYSISGLNSANEYEFYVLADCDFGESDWVGPVAFETLPPPPTNDICSNAIELNCDVVVNGSTLNATADGSIANCGTFLGDAPGVWYVFNGNGSEITLSLCGSAYDSKIGVFSGTCNSLTCVIGEDDDCGANPEVTLTTTDGLNYYVYVTGNNGAFGDFLLTLSGGDTTIITTTSCNPADTGTEVIMLVNSLGCDSIVSIITTLLPSYLDTNYYASCTLDLVGEMIDSNATENGCDSIIVTITTLLPGLTTTNQLYTCDPIEVGTFVDTFVAANGCDSLSITNVSLLSEVIFINQLYTCDTNEISEVIDTFVSSNGCDSVVTTIVSLLSDVIFTNQLYTCDLNEVGSQTDTFVSANGCDSTVVTITDLFSPLPILNQLYTCDPEEVGTAIDTFVTTDGCDSITVTLTALYPDVSSTNQLFTCDANEAGTTIDTFAATTGCDSLVTTITSLLSDTIFANEAYTCFINDVGESTDTFTSFGGCDSVIHTITSLLPDVTTTIQLYTCVPNEVGTAVDTFSATDGCDSIVISTTGLLSDETFINHLFTCEPNEVGSVTDTLVASAGCDSVVMTITSLLSDTAFTIQLFTCDIDEVGTSIDTLASFGGCDSINITITTLSESDSIGVFATSCNPDDIGIETLILTNSIGCDSIVTTITTFGDYLESYTVYTCNANEVGTTIDTFIIEDNCDSIVEVITIFEGVTASFDYFLVDTSIQFFNESQNADSYLWLFGDGTSSVINNPLHYYVQEGGYGVQLIASNEYCSDTIFKAIEVRFPTGIGLNDLIESIVLYPNPNNGTFEVELKSRNYNAILDLTLYSLTGKRIDTRVINFNNYTREKYSYSELTAGSYFLQIQDGSNRLVLKIKVVR